MIEALLPGSVSCADSRSDAVPPDALFPAEVEFVRESVVKRQREFAAVRVCARRAMAAIGLPPSPVLNGSRGEPRWPHGVVGTMTHCSGYCAAAVARRHDIRSLGIDAEPHAPLPSGVLEAIALPGEQRRLAGDRGPETLHWDRLLFSAKESVFKTWYPATGIALDFCDAEIVFQRCSGSLASGIFNVHLRRFVPTALQEFEGRWMVCEDFALTAVVIPAV